MSSTFIPQPTLNWIAANQAAESHAPFVDVFLALFGMEATRDNVAKDVHNVLGKIKEMAQQEPEGNLPIAAVFDHFIKTAHTTSMSKGFWKLRETVVWPVSDEDSEIAVHVMLSRLMLVASEVSEAAEAVREGRYVTEYGENGKPEGVLPELADVFIRVCDLLGVVEEMTQESFASVVLQKLAYNTTRPMMHGKKA